MFIKKLLKNLVSKNNVELNYSFNKLYKLKTLHKSQLYNLDKMIKPNYVIKSNIKTLTIGSSMILFDIYNNNIIQYGYITIFGIGYSLCIIKTQNTVDNYIKISKPELEKIEKIIKKQEKIYNKLCKKK